jgi:anti-anti-sigma factor
MHQDVTKVRHLVLSGEYDLARRAELSSQLATLSVDAPVTIDMRAVSFVDSTFLKELAAFRLRLPDGQVRLLGVQTSVRRVFQFTRLDRFFVFIDE